jgi:hypothetical protein
MKSESSDIALVSKIAEVIEKSRRIASAPSLDGDEIIKTADAWAEVLAGFTSADIERAYREVMPGYKGRTPLQPGDLLKSLRGGRESARKKSAEVLSDPVECPHCDGIGYQIVSETRYGREYTSSRGCSCANCPPGQRQAHPLEPPKWLRDRRGYWSFASANFGLGDETAA